MSSPETKKPLNPWSIWIPIILIMMGVVVLYNYLVMETLQREKDRPPYYTRLEHDLKNLTERSGKTVALNDLRGKVILMGYVYTSCPRGCSLVVEEMKHVYDEFAPKHPGLQLVSFTIDPDDTPENMKKFAEARGITQDNWWFLNGPKTEVRNFLTYDVKFYAVKEIPEKERFSPMDKYEHDMRVALIDHEGHVRGMYKIMDGDPEFQKLDREKLRRNLAYLLAEQEKAAAHKS